MVLDAVYEHCLTTLASSLLDDEEQADQVEKILAAPPISMKGQKLEDAVLEILWLLKVDSDNCPLPPRAARTFNKTGRTPPFFSKRDLRYQKCSEWQPNRTADTQGGGNLHYARHRPRIPRYTTPWCTPPLPTDTDFCAATSDHRETIGLSPSTSSTSSFMPSPCSTSSFTPSPCSTPKRAWNERAASDTTYDSDDSSFPWSPAAPGWYSSSHHLRLAVCPESSLATTFCQNHEFDWMERPIHPDSYMVHRREASTSTQLRSYFSRVVSKPHHMASSGPLSRHDAAFWNQSVSISFAMNICMQATSATTSRRLPRRSLTKSEAMRQASAMRNSQ